MMQLNLPKQLGNKSAKYQIADSLKYISNQQGIIENTTKAAIGKHECFGRAPNFSDIS